MDLTKKAVYISIFAVALANIGKCQEIVHLADGSSLNCKVIRHDASALILQLPSGVVTFPKSAFALDTQQKYFKSAPLVNADVTSGKLSPRQQVSVKVSQQYPSLSEKHPSPQRSESIKKLVSNFPESLTSIPANSSSSHFSLKEVQFSIEGKYQVQACIPIDSSGKIPASASDMVFFGHYLGSFPGIIPDKGSNPDKFLQILISTLKDLAKSHGMTVFTVIFPNKGVDPDDHKSCFYYPESGSYSIITNAWKKLVSDYGLERRKLFLLGLSGGSTLVERFAILNSPDIAALAISGGSRFGDITVRPNFPILVTHARDDVRTEENIEFVEKARQMGTNVLYAITELRSAQKELFVKRESSNFHHLPSQSFFDLAEEFFVAVKDRQISDQRTDVYDKWPYQASVADPLSVAVNEGKAPDLGNKFFFPSERFVRVWENSVYRNSNLSYQNGAGATQVLPLTIRYPRDKPKAIIIVATGTEVPDSDRGDISDYLGEQGIICIHARLSDDEGEQRLQSSALFQWVNSLRSFEKLPLVLLGTGSGTGGLITSSQMLSEDRSKVPIYVYGSPADWSCENMPEIPGVSKIALTVLLNQRSKNYGDSDLRAFTEKLESKGCIVRSLQFPNSDPNMEYFDLTEAVLKFEHLVRKN